MLARDAVAELVRRIDRTQDDQLFVFNALPFPRTVVLSGKDVTERAFRGRPDDPTAARHSMDRGNMLSGTAVGTVSMTKDRPAPTPVQLPAFGYTVVPPSGSSPSPQIVSDDLTVETSGHGVEFDRESGNVTSWYSTSLERDLLDHDAGWPLGGWVHERPIVDEAEQGNPRRTMWSLVEQRLGLERGWRPGWLASRRGPERLLEHRIERRDDGADVLQRFELPDGSALHKRTYLPAFADWIECTSMWQMGLETDPQATYIAFPFAVPDAVVHLDLGGQAMRIDADQLPRSCRDFFTVHGWVDFSDSEFGVTVACPNAPLVQLGDFTFGSGLETVSPPRAMLLGWVTNNYWETNFRAHQPGMVGARNRLPPHADGFDEAAAHRAGLDAASPPLAHHLLEPPVAGPRLPAAGSVLVLAEFPVLTLHIWPDASNVCVRFLNASDDPVSATIGSDVLRLTSAVRCELLGVPVEELTVERDAVTFSMEPRTLTTVRTTLELA